LYGQGAKASVSHSRDLRVECAPLAPAKVFASETSFDDLSSRFNWDFVAAREVQLPSFDVSFVVSHANFRNPAARDLVIRAGLSPPASLA
jgi:hypothetical protein